MQQGFLDLKRSFSCHRACTLRTQKSPADLRAEANVSAAFRARTLRRQRKANASWQFLQKSISVQRNLFLKGHLGLRAISGWRDSPKSGGALLIRLLQLQVQWGIHNSCWKYHLWSLSDVPVTFTTVGLTPVWCSEGSRCSWADAWSGVNVPLLVHIILESAIYYKCHLFAPLNYSQGSTKSKRS